MKRKTFYNISLSLPYIALLFCGVWSFALAVADSTVSALGLSSDHLGVGLLGVAVFFLTGGVFWVPLYTWMVVVLLFWSRGKTADEVRNMYLLSPVLLGCSMGIPAVFIDLRLSMLLFFLGFLRTANLEFVVRTFISEDSLSQALAIGVMWGLMAALCLMVGYAFVGIVVLIERGMKKRGLLKEEAAGARSHLL